MSKVITCLINPSRRVLHFLLAWQFCLLSAQANPTGGSVTQGSASFNTSGSQFTINQTSANAFFNWSTFNIGAGETTTFVQPSSTSVAWNRINDVNPSQILGNLNANGFVVLQNQSGFVVGGQASITAHGLVMTTASSPMPSLSSGGAWQFDTPPPLAKIVNYGQITLAGGGSAFLIANDIQNNGTISAPGGKIGLYAGQQVLVSSSPDGRGLSAKVTLPQGSVDNEGRLIADAGSIIAQAKTVNNNGLVQANSVRNNHGVIELLASDEVNLNAGSVISAQGDATGISAGGSITIRSDNNFIDQAGSAIKIAGGAQGGNGGQIEISAPQTGPLQSTILGAAAHGFTGGTLTIDPTDITLNSAYVASLNNEISGGLSLIDLQADDTIRLTTTWILAGLSAPGTVNLTAGNNIIFDTGTFLKAGSGWSVNLKAGTAFAASGGSQPESGSDGIYLKGSAYLQTQDGNLNLWAANEVQVGWSGNSLGAGMVNTGTGRITTTGGGAISVTTVYGDINTGSDVNGYTFGLGNNTPLGTPSPYYKVNANLGGISTMAGGDVTLAAAGDVISYLPRQSDYNNALHDAGTGAFGWQGGNVSITAGGNIYGHFVVANGAGTVTAGGDIGAPLSTLSFNPGAGFALSLIKGSWNVSAPNGSIYVQDVRNPNGIFGEKNAGSSPANYTGYHYFDYDPAASVSLSAGAAVEITGYDAPHLPASSGDSIPLIFPPSLTVDAGAGGFILDASVILFPAFDPNGNPSANQNLSITTHNGGNFGIPNSESPYTTDPVTLEMSDSASKQWLSVKSYTTGDNAAELGTANNPGPVEISISGSVNDVNLYTTKATQMTVGGDMINSGFSGQNLAASGVNSITSIKVTGNIYDSPLDTFALLTSGIASANPNQPGMWDTFFNLAIDPSLAAALANVDVNSIPKSETLAAYLKQFNYLLFPSASTIAYGANPGFIYDASARILGFQGVMPVRLSAAQIAALENGTFTVLVADANGNPVVDASGHLATRTYSFSAASTIAGLDAGSLTAVYNVNATHLGFQVGGPGEFSIHAASINLGNTPGIGSLGFSGNPALASLLPVAATGGASVSVTADGSLNMITSSIYSEDGGNVIVKVGGELDLSEGTDGHFFNFTTPVAYGIYTSGHSDVSVTADGNINVGSARIATFDGGNVFVESFNGDVSVGTGVTEALSVFGVILDPVSNLPESVQFGDNTDATTLLKNPPPFGSGILAEIPTKAYQSGGISQPGNILVETPHGNIVSTSGGISQIALQGTVQGPSVTLIAGIPGVTSPTDAHAGNVLLGAGGVVGGDVTVTGTGKIQGYFVSQENLNVKGQSFSGLGLAGQSANVTASEPSGGPAIVVGIGSVNASGLGSSATLLGQNVSANGGPAQSTLGNSVNASTASQNAAGEASADTKQQVASNDNGADDDAKKKKLHPLMQHLKRVTVILPKS